MIEEGTSLSTLLIRVWRKHSRIVMEREEFPEPVFRYYDVNLGHRRLQLTLPATSLTTAEAEEVRQIMANELADVLRRLYGLRPRRPRGRRRRQVRIGRPGTPFAKYAPQFPKSD